MPPLSLAVLVASLILHYLLRAPLSSQATPYSSRGFGHGESLLQQSFPPFSPFSQRLAAHSQCYQTLEQAFFDLTTLHSLHSLRPRPKNRCSLAMLGRIPIVPTAVAILTVVGTTLAHPKVVHFDLIRRDAPNHPKLFDQWQPPNCWQCLHHQHHRRHTTSVHDHPARHRQQRYRASRFSPLYDASIGVRSQ